MKLGLKEMVLGVSLVLALPGCAEENPAEPALTAAAIGDMSEGEIAAAIEKLSPGQRVSLYCELVGKRVFNEIVSESPDVDPGVARAAHEASNLMFDECMKRGGRM